MAGFCAKCGTRLDDNVGFCPNCGNAVQSVQNIQTQTFQFDQPQTDFYQSALPVPPPPTEQPDSKKSGMSNIAAFFLAIVVLAVGTTGFFAFKENGFLRRDSEETSKDSSSKSEKKDKTDKKKTEKEVDTPKAEKKDTANNTVEWDGTLYDVEIPKPDGYDKVYNIVDDLNSTVVYIDGVTYDEYKAYCKSIEDSSDWVPVDKTPPEDTAHFPDDYNDVGIVVYFSGTYKGNLHLSVQYHSDAFCEGTEITHFSILARLI